MFEEQDRVGILDRAPQQSGGVGRCRRHHDLDPGDVGVEGLDRLRVVQGAVDPAAARCADHHRYAEVAVRPVAQSSGLRDDLIERGMDEVRELDLGDREESVQRHPDRDPDDAGLRERRVDHALLAELLHPSVGDPEHAATRTHVLTEQDDALVVRPSRRGARRGSP